MRLGVAATGLLLLLAMSACSRGHDSSGLSAQDAPIAARAPASPAPPAPPTVGARGLASPTPFVELAVPGYAPAVVSLPIGAEGPRPVLVATQGNFDKPEWQCDMWRSVVQSRGFVLCPRGDRHPASPSPADPRHRYASNAALEKEIHAALSALKERFPEHVDAERAVYAGFSQGAIMGVPILSRNAAKFPRAVLIEGGYDRWSADFVRLYSKGGGDRVLFACGQPLCARAAERSAKALGKGDVEALVVHGEGEGHSYFGKVADQVRRAFAWVVASDPRWSEAGPASTGAPSDSPR
jgi:hypothetical protein